MFVLCLGINRAIGGEPYLVRSADALAVAQKNSLLGLAVVVGAAAGVMAASASSLFDNPLRDSLVGLSVALPALLVQDACRFIALGQKRLKTAFLIDGIWILFLVPAFTIAHAAETNSVSTWLLLWGAGAFVSSLFGFMSLKCHPMPHLAYQWFRDNAPLSLRFLGEFGVTTAGNQLALFVVGAALGLEQVGALRGAQLMLSPINILSMGGAMVALPIAASWVSQERNPVSLCRVFSSFLGAVALIWGTIVYIVPADVGSQLLGDVWSSGHEVLIPMTIALAAAGVTLGASLGLRSLAAAAAGLRVRVYVAMILVASVGTGAWLGGLHLAAWSLAGAATLGAFMWWREFTRAESTLYK